MDKKRALKDYEDICVCNGKLQGAWSEDDYYNEEIVEMYEFHIFDIANDYNIPIPSMAKYDEYQEDYMNAEARVTDVYWALQRKLEEIILG